MGINKDFFVEQQGVEWNGVVVCTVRGITPNDIARVMAENTKQVEELMESFQKEKLLSGLDPSQVQSIDIEAESAKIFQRIITMVPDLAAKVIAIAADDPEAWELIRERFVLPLQFEALTRIAQLTFIDSNGFKKFLGNVLALVGNASGNGQRLTQPESAMMPGTDG